MFGRKKQEQPSIEEKVEKAVEAVSAEGTENAADVKPGKKFGSRAKGMALMAAGIFSLAAGVWMFIQTLGTHLLFMSAGLGRVCRYYWILWGLAAVCLIMGRIMLKRNPRRKTDKSEPAETEMLNADKVEEKIPAPKIPEIQEMICPKCGKPYKPGSRFCTGCGQRLAENGQ